MDEMINNILASIKSYLTKTSLDEPFYMAVLKRLVSFGYTLKEDDAWVINFCIQKVENHIKNSCNILSVPNGLFNVAVDMVCGEFLLALKQTGQLDIEAIDLRGAISQLKEGDTTIQFADGSSEDEKFTGFVNYLLTRGEGDFVCYRRLKW